MLGADACKATRGTSMASGVKNMTKREIGEMHVFVRATANGYEHTELSCYTDSAGFVADGAYHVFEFTEDPAGYAMAKLSELGFTEIRVAKAAGLVPESWSPTPESFVLKRSTAQ